MHWFWRAVMAVGIPATLYAGLLVFASVLPGDRPAMGSINAFQLAFPLFFVSACGAATLGCYAFLTWRFGPARFKDNETRCRKCNYILRGITEPRCPECGEGI